MYLQVSQVIVWCLGMSLLALAYGEYASMRQAWGRPISIKERFRNFLILHAACVGITAFLSIFWTQLPLYFVLEVLRPFAIYALAPIVLWYCFDLPLRLVHHLTRSRRPKANAVHPLDGAWSEESSFVDNLSSPSLDRVAQLRRVEPPPAAESPGD